MNIWALKELAFLRQLPARLQALRGNSGKASTHTEHRSGIQAIILAAGRGSRLEESNEGRPKCLAAVNGRRLIDYQLSALSRAGITDVCVVTGYRAEEVMSAVADRARFVHNPDWPNSNSLYSLSLCRDWVKRRVIVLNCDVLAHPDVLSRLVKRGSSSFAYDSSSGDDEEHMKVELEGDRLLAMSKVLPHRLTAGENVGLLNFSYADAKILFEQAEQLLRAGGKNLWLASAVERVAELVPLHGIDVSDLPWIEIDYGHDLTHARRWVGPAIRTAMAPIRVAFAGAVA